MTGDFEGCIVICEKELSTNKDNLVALRFLSRSKTKLGYDANILIDNWEELLQREPDNLEAINNIARALIRIGKRDEAFDKTSLVLELNPHYSPALQTMKNLEKTL